MLDFLTKSAERMITQLVAGIIGIIIFSIILGVTVSFSAFTIYLFANQWFTPALSSLITTAILLLAVLFTIMIVRRSIAPAQPPTVQGKRRQTDTQDYPKQPLSQAGMMDKLTLAVMAGFLYETNPEIRQDMVQLLFMLSPSQVNRIHE